MIGSQQFASIGRRFVALLIDMLLLSIPCVWANYVLPIIGGAALWFFYGPILECSELRATLGKYWMGIQVADVEGRRVSFQTSLLRNVIKLFSSALLCLGYALVLFTKNKQTLHDLAADTVVVYGKSAESVFTPWANSVRKVFNFQFLSNEDPLSKIERLQSLREKGAITEEEFQAAKKKILTDEIS